MMFSIDENEIDTIHLAKQSESKSKSKSKSESETAIETINAATVVCLRQHASSNKCGWEVLLGQGEVKNWLRSTQEKLVLMSYPGEWKLPGGGQETQDVSLQYTAFRELKEEFLGMEPKWEEFHVHCLSPRLTLPINGRRYVMHNFIALEDENPWLSRYSLDCINTKLCERKENYTHLVATNEYWHLSKKEKQEIAPEVNRVNWIRIEDAIKMMSSTGQNKLHAVDEWQEKEFLKYGILQRDPMEQTQKILLEIAQFNSFQEIRDYTQKFVNENDE